MHPRVRTLIQQFFKKKKKKKKRKKEGENKNGTPAVTVLQGVFFRYFSTTFLQLIFNPQCLSPAEGEVALSPPFLCHLMKEEIETKHFENTFGVLGTNRAAEPLLTKQVEVCAFHNPSHGFYRVMSVKFLFLPSAALHSATSATVAMLLQKHCARDNSKITAKRSFFFSKLLVHPSKTCPKMDVFDAFCFTKTTFWGGGFFVACSRATCSASSTAPRK